MTARRLVRGVRGRLLLIVVLAIAFALAVATAGFNVLFARATSRNADSFLRAKASAELALVSVSHGRIHVDETSDDALGDSLVWIFRGTRAVEVPRAAADTTAAARSLAGGPRRFISVRDTDRRLYAIPIDDDHRRVGTLVTGVSLAPYEQTRRAALLGSLALALTVLAVVGVAVWWLLRSALSPVVRMTAQAAAWSENDLDRRFAPGEPHDELTRLAATLDGLLDRLAASLRHERRFSAEMSHELRTPLAKLVAEAELALRRERSADEYRTALATVIENAHQIERIVESLVAAAQQETTPRGVADAADVARAVAGTCAAVAHERGVSIALDEPPAEMRVGVDGDLAERILHPVVENACRYGRSRVRIAVARDGTGVAFSVEDDGPGVDTGEQEAIFEPAIRGRAGHSAGAGAGLGLALARRLARAVSGDVLVQAGVHGRFVVRLPAA
jgi:two-component system, OmpR family, sensor kinase